MHDRGLLLGLCKTMPCILVVPTHVLETLPTCSSGVMRRLTLSRDRTVSRADSDRGTHDFSGASLGLKGHEVQDTAWMASVGSVSTAVWTLGRVHDGV